LDCFTPAYSRTLRRLLRGANLAEIGAAWDTLTREAQAELAAEGFIGPRAHVKRSAALHYKGQTYELVVPVPDGPINDGTVAVLETAFAEEHERTYGHRAGPDEPVELVSIQVVGLGLRDHGMPERLRSDRPEPLPPPPRPAWFGAAHGWVKTPVLRRSELVGGRTGPLIVEEYDATCLVPPSARAELDEPGNIVIEFG
jgi:N-methylhydantoinase A